MLAAMTAAASIATAATKTVIVKKTVAGPQAIADRWGYVEVTLVVRKTTTTIGTHKKVTRKITAVNVPVFPNHTDRSIFINQQAIPWLKQEVLRAQFNPNINMIGGATATSYAFEQSLQAALILARKV